MYEKTKEAIEQLPDEQKPMAKSLLQDVEYWSDKVKELQKCQTYQIDPKNPLRQRKLPAHDMLKEAEQQKINAMRTLIQIFNKDRVLNEEDELSKRLAEFE